MANIVITPIQSVLSIYLSSYPSGANASTVRSILIANTNILKDAGITDLVLSTSPNIGLGPAQSITNFMVFVQAYVEGGETIVLTPGQIAYNIDVFFINDAGASVDDTPPNIEPKGSTEIIIQTGQFFSSTTLDQLKNPQIQPQLGQPQTSQVNNINQTQENGIQNQAY